jgi:hypothetical protein
MRSIVLYTPYFVSRAWRQKSAATVAHLLHILLHSLFPAYLGTAVHPAPILCALGQTSWNAVENVIYTYGH